MPVPDLGRSEPSWDSPLDGRHKLYHDVDKYTLSHLHPSTRANHAALEACLAACRASGLPPIHSSPVFAKQLAVAALAGGPTTHALEVGTLGGYVCIWLATTVPGLRVTSLEADPRHAAVARRNCAAAGVADRVEIIEGEALATLPRLQHEIRSGRREPFGLTYIDADKINNWRYFEFAVAMSRVGASIYVDNVVRGATLIMPEKRETEDVVGARQLVENVGKDERVEAVVMQTVNEKSYDGYLMAVVLSN